MSQGLFSLAGKVALVTGAGSGIGREIAALYARQGATVWIGELNATAGEAAAAAIRAEGGQAHFVALDVTRRESVSAAFAGVSGATGRLDILVNNAGIGHVGKVVDATDEDFDRLMAVNAKGVFLCSQAAVRQMLAQQPKGGAIVNIASIASLIGIADRFLYCATKGAVLQMTRSVALDYVKDGIRCNCICPARVHTPFVDDYLKKNYPGKEAEVFAQLSAYQPIGRMGRPDEVAKLALYLASDEAGFMTGTALPLDGGVTMA